MMKTVRPLLAAALLAAILTGCASGPKYGEVANAIPTLREGQGRIYFLRPRSVIGAARQPEIRLNNVVVGTSKPGGFFFVDRMPGPYQAAASSEIESTLDFSLYPGEVKYVRTSASFGLLLGRVGFTLIDEGEAREEMRELSYIGKPLADDVR